MVAVVSGNGLGLFNSSLALLGSGGAVGDPKEGRANERLYVNSTTGNLVVQVHDEALTALGLDLALVRTYNSQGLLNDDNGDNWQLGLHEGLSDLVGTINTNGSQITKTFGDGSRVVYTCDGALYVSADGNGAHDTLSWNSGTSQWTWTDGSTRTVQTYDASGRLLSSRDTDGNTTTYTYTGNLLTQVADASGQNTFLDYTGNNLTQIRVVSSGVTQTITRYTYDSQERLSEVRVDLSPEDNSIADNNVYKTTYTYEGTSRRIASISQGTDSVVASTVNFTYQLVSGEYRLQTYTDGEGKITTFSYTGVTSGQTTAPANSGALTTTEQVQTPYNLNTGLLTTPTPTWGGAAAIDAQSAAVSDPRIGFGSNGNGLAIWRESANLWARPYTRSTDTWGTAVQIDTLSGTIANPQLAVDASGNAVAVWVQTASSVNNLYASRFDVGTGTWSAPALVETGTIAVSTAADRLSVSINGSQAAISWLQPTSGSTNDVWVSRWTGSAWSAPVAVDNQSSSAAKTSVAVDDQGNVTVLIQQASTSNIYANRWSAASSTWAGAAAIDAQSAAVSDPRIGFGSNGNGLAIWRESANLWARPYTRSTDTWGTAVQIDTLSGTIANPQLAVDASGNAVAVWVQSVSSVNSLYASRFDVGTGTWSAPALVETGTIAVSTAADSLSVSINGSQAAISWLQPTSGSTNDVWVSSWTGSAWSTPVAVDNQSSSAAKTSVAVDDQGNVSVLIQQASTSNIYANRLTNATGAPYYTIPGGATWQSLANTLYGVNSVEAGDALQTAMGGGAVPGSGTQVAGWPATITVTTTQTVPAYYSVLASDTWTTITQSVYGTSDAGAVAALKTALGSPTLSTGLPLTVPATLAYTPAGTFSGATQVDISNHLGQVTSFQNDAQGRLTAMLSPTVNGVRLETRYGYDADGNVISVTEDPTGANRITTNEYDSKGNLTLSRDSIGNTIQRTYDTTTNQLITETLYTVPDPDGGGSGQPSGALTTRYAYDSEQHLRFVISADGRVTEHVYLANGNRASTIIHAGARYDVSGLTPTTALTEAQLITWAGSQTLTQIERTDFEYDFRGNVMTATAYASTTAGGAGASAGSSVTRFVYDQRGRLLSTIDPPGETTSGDPTDYVTTFTYDGLGRVLTSVRWTATGNVTTLSNTYDDGTRSDTTTRPNGLVTTTVSDRVGRTLSVSASNGQPLGTTTYTYDDAGRLRMVTDPLGIKTHNVYDAAGRNIFTVDGDGTLTEFIYDRLNNVVKTVQYAVAANTALLVDGLGVPLASVDTTALRASANGQSANNRIFRSVYDGAHRAVYTIDAAGAVTKNTYDGTSRLTDQLSYATTVSIPAATDELTLTAGGAITGVTLDTSADDRVSRMFFDNDGNVVGTLDGNGYLVKNVYDAAGHLVQTVAYANAATVTAGTLSAVEGSITPDSANDIVTYAFYDGQGRRIGALDGEKFLTEWRYDVAGNVAQMIRYPTVRTFTGTPTFGGVLPANTLGAHITSYQYDEQNRLTLETNFENVQTQYEYDNVGNLIQTTRALGEPEARVTQARYDALGRVTAELTAEGSAAIAALGGSPTQGQIDGVWDQYGVKYAYDNSGRRISATDQYGNVRLFFYDADSRQRFSVMLVGGGLGEVTESRYNALGQLTANIAYGTRVNTAGFAGGDINGTLTAAVAAAVDLIDDPAKDASTTYTYTAAGLVATEVTGAGSSVTRAYNAFGELATSSQLIDTSPSATTLDHEYTYDKRGTLLTTRWDPSGLNTTESRTYDAFGRVKTETDAGGNVTQYAYDRMGRTLTVTDPFLKTVEMTYDAFSRLLTTKDRLNQITEYDIEDAFRRVTITTPEGTTIVNVHNAHGQTLTVTDPRGTVVNYEYDANGQIKRVFDTIGDVSRQTYDRAGRGVDSIDANGVITRVTYDAASRVLTRTVNPGGLALTTTYVYDPLGRTITTTDARGVATQTAYDQDGRVTTITVDQGGLNLTTTFTYDKRGMVKVETTGAGSSNPRTVTYQYDKLGRRISETVVIGNGQPDSLTQYKYDANGNVTRKIDARNYSTWYVYDAGDRLRYTIDSLGGVTQTTYDDEGRVTSTRRHAAPVPYTGSLGHVVTLADLNALGMPGTSNADRLEETVYDRDGRDVYNIRTLDAAGNGLVTEKTFDGNGNVVHKRVYANTIGAGVARTATGVAAALAPSASLDRESFSTYDIRNRAAFVIDAAGGVIRNEYDGAGNVVAQTQYFNTRPTTSTPTNGDMVSWAGTSANAADRTTRHWYDAAGRSVFTLDAEGYLTENRYSDATRSDEVFAYYAKPSVTLTGTSTLQNVIDARVTGPNDRYLKTEYDKGGRITQVTTAISASENAIEQYTYDAVGNRLSYTNAKNSTWDYTYDANGRLIEELGPAVAIWDTYGQVDQTPSPVRIATRMTYDPLGNVLSRTEAYGRTEARTTSYEYDPLGRQTRTIFPPIYIYSEPAGDELVVGSAVTRIEHQVTPDSVVTYNTLGDAVVNRDIAGNYSHKAYDRLGRVKYEVDAEQYVTEHVYDSFGNETSTIRYAARLDTATLALSAEWTIADFTPARLTANAETDRTLTTQYDRVNRVTHVTQPAVHNFLPNPGSAPGGAVVDNTGALTRYDYNAFGEVTRQRQLVVGTTYAETYFYYDHRGLRIATVDPRGHLSIAEYDAIGNQTRSVEYAKALGTPPTQPNDTYSGLQTSTPAANENDPAGYDRETLFTYDRLNRVKTESLINVEYTTISGDATTREANGIRTTTYDYDAVGNRIASTDASGAITRTYYDALGRVIAIAEPTRNLGTSITATTIAYNWTPSGYIETFQYRAAGAQTWTTLSAYGTVNLGALVNGNYDWYLSVSSVDMYGTPVPVGYAMGTLTVNGASSSSSVTSSSNAPIPTMTASTPPPSTAIVTPLQEMRRDAFGNLVMHVQWGGGASSLNASTFTAASVPSTDRITRVAVDKYGNTLRTIDAEGGIVEQSYTVRGEVAKDWQLVTNNDSVVDAIVTIYQYDKLGQQTTIIEPARLDAVMTQVARTEVDYNAFGEIITKTVNNVETEYYDYDKAGRVWRSNAGDGVNKVYLYDLLGNTTAEIRSQTVNLKTGVNNAAQAFGLGLTDQMRTETRYDLMGHALEQRQVTFDAPAAQESINTPILFGSLTMPNPPNAVYQEVYYPDPYNPYVQYVFNPTSYANNGGWYQVEAPSSSNPYGTYARVAPESYSISQRGFIYWNAPTQLGLDKTFEYRQGSGSWQTLLVNQVNTSQVGVDISGLSNNTYEYRISYTRAGDPGPYAIATGTFAVNNANVTTLSVAAGGGAGSISLGSVSLSGTSLTVTWDGYGPGTFEIKPTSSSTWQSFTSSFFPGDMYNPPYSYVTATGITPGTYDYRITHTNNGAITQIGFGTVSVSNPTSSTTGSAAPAANWGNAIGALTGSSNIAVSVGSAVGSISGVAASMSGSTLSVTWDPVGTTATFEVKSTGSSTWTSVAATYVPGDMYTAAYMYANVGGIGPGSYDYRITHTSNGVTTAIGVGTISVSSPTSSTTGSASPSASWGNAIGPLTGARTVSVSAGAAIAGISVTGSSISGGTLTVTWDPSVSTTAVFEVKSTSSGTWTTVNATYVPGDMYTPQYMYAQVGGIGPGSYDYRITHTSNGVTVAMGIGTFSVSTPSTSTTGSATPSAPWGNAIGALNGYATQSGGGATTISFSWAYTGYTEAFYYRTAGGSWVYGGTGGSASLGALANGNYEYYLEYGTYDMYGNYFPVGSSSGTFVVNGASSFRTHISGSPVPTLTATTPPVVTTTTLYWPIDASIAGTPYFYYRPVGGSWTNLGINNNGAGSYYVQANGLGGNYEFSIEYWVSDGYSSWTTATASGTFSVSGTSVSITSQTGTPSYLSGVSASGSNLFWSRALQSGDSLTVQLNGSINLTPQTSDGTNYWASFNGIASGNYAYEIAYWRLGAKYVVGSGNLSISTTTTPSTVSMSAASSVSAISGFQSIGGAQVGWTTAASGGDTVTFRYKPTSSGSWSGTLTPFAWSTGYAVDFGSLSGTFDYEVTYTAAGAYSPYRVARGTTTITPTLSWPIDGSIQGTPYFSYRTPGGSWTGLSVGSAGGNYQVVANLGSGSYEWMIEYWMTDGYSSWTTATASGTFTVSGSTLTVTSQTGTPSYLAGVTASGSNLFWSRALQSGDSLTVQLNGSINLTPQTSDGTNYWASFNGLSSGNYSYEIAYWRLGSKYVVGTGSLSITTTVTPSAASISAPTSVSAISGVQAISATQLGWTTAPNGGDTVTFRYKPTGSGSWTGTLTPFAWSTGRAVDFGTSLSGTFDYEISYTASGGHTPYRITYGTTNITPRLAWPIDASIQGTPAFSYRPAGGGSWTGLSVGTSGGTYQVAANFSSGSYEWMIEYWVTDGYTSWTTATAQGTFTVSGSTITVTSQTGTPSYLAGVTASGSNLFWSRALQAGDSLTVQLNGSINLTPQTSDGTNYWASFDGLTTGAYAYEIAYWKAGAKYVVGSGSVSITTTVTPSQPTMSAPTSVGQITGFYDGGGGLLAWTTPLSGGTVQVRYRAAGAGSWAGTLNATPYGGAYAVNLDSPTPLNGSIEVEVQYIGANGSPYMIGRATTTITRGIQTTGSITDTTSSTLAPVAVTPRLQQTFDRWGNVLTSISAALAQTNYRYNQFGNVAEVQLPTSDIVSTINGAVVAYYDSRPIQRNYFDVLGRVIATRDGNANHVTNGKMNKVQYNEAGQVISETYADDGTKSYVLDTFGQQIQVMDQLNYRTRMVYDRTGNLLSQARELTTSGFLNVPPSDLTPRDSTSTVRNDYTYDAAGRRLSETTGETMGTSGTTPETTRYWYDLNGNIVKRTTPRGNPTTYEYDINGHKSLERNAINEAQSWTYDNYGRVLTQTDLGGAVTTFTYNGISKYLTSQTSTLGQAINYFYDAAGNLTKMEDRGTASGDLDAVDRDTEISYDAAGRRARERVVVNGLVHQDTHITYDSQDRVAQLSDLRYTVTYRYDDSGNRSRIKATYYDHSGIAQVQDLWYTYDAMNRVRFSQGVNTAGDTETSGTVTINSIQGIELTYDAKGQRTSARQYGQKLNRVNGTYSYTNDYSTETYGFDGAGRLVTTDRSMTQTVGSTTTETTQRIDTRTYDKAARELWVTSTEFEMVNNVLTAVGRARGTTYDDDGRTATQVTSKNGVKESYVTYGDAVYNPVTTWWYPDPWTGELVEHTWGGNWTPGYDAAGVLRGYIVQVYDTATTGNPNDTAYSSTYVINYRNSSSYQETSTTVTSAQGTSTSYPAYGVPQSGATGRTYNVNGELVSTYDTRDGSKNRYFATDASGQAMTVVQGQYDGQAGRWTPTQAFQYALANAGAYNTTKSQHFFFALGQQVGSYGQLSNGSGAFKANFDVNYTPVSDTYPDTVPSEVVAQQGDTLRVLAARLFGDQNLWYLIAEENGLSDPDAPIEPGTVLRVPSEVVSVSNASGSFKPFDAQAAIGDTSPTQPMPPAPKPKKKKGCGVLGMILMIVVVVVVTIYTAGALTQGAVGAFSATMSAGAGAMTAGTLTLGQAALAAAVGSIAGQAVGIATGVQDKFSWKGVALAAVGGAVTAGLGNWGAFGDAMQKVASVNPYLGVGVSAAANNVITQGVSLALGLQKKFDWKSVAVSAVGAPLAKWAGDKVGAWAAGSEDAYKNAVDSHTYNFARFAADATGTLTMTAVRAAVGGKFDISQVVADVFGNAMANAIVDRFSAPPPAAAAAATAEAGSSDEPLEEIVVTAEKIDTNPANTIRAGSEVTPDERRDSYYVVQKGDSVARIAREHYGDERYAAIILAANNMSADYRTVHTLRIGRDLLLPDVSAFSSEQLDSLLGAGGSLISNDQAMTDFFTARAEAERAYAEQQRVAAEAERAAAAAQSRSRFSDFSYDFGSSRFNLDFSGFDASTAFCPRYETRPTGTIGPLPPLYERMWGDVKAIFRGDVGVFEGLDILAGEVSFSYGILDDEYKVTNRGLGALGVAGSSLEVVGGVGLMATAETGIGAVASVAVTANGVDNFQASWRTMVSGNNVDPLGLQLLDATGMDPTAARVLYTGANLGAGVATAPRLLANTADTMYVARAPISMENSGTTLYTSTMVPIQGWQTPLVRIETVTDEMREAYRGVGYLDPLTNTFKAAPTDDVMAVDHIVATATIRDMPGFSSLRPNQMRAIMQDTVGLGNLQPLPGSLNSSKGARMPWTTYNGKPINAQYASDLAARQQQLMQAIRQQIDTFRAANRAAGP